ncbi:MAG: Maf family protein [Myxococcota bacterium]
MSINLNKYPSKIALASSSPRRRELLQSLGFELTLLDPNIDESQRPDETPENLVLRLAVEKAQAVAHLTDLPIMAADTVVVVEGVILGKPHDIHHARDMILQLSGKEHLVLTGYALSYQNRLVNNLAQTTITFRDLCDYEVDNYLQTGQWAGKAGACTLQGASGPFVNNINGSLANVLGLPLNEVLAALQKVA